MNIGCWIIDWMMDVLAACHSFGLDGLKGTQPFCNEAISASMNEQFGQNLARLHYPTPPISSMSPTSRQRWSWISVAD